MKTIYQYKNKQLTKQTKILANYFIELINPEKEELEAIKKKLKIDEKDIEKALDRAELPHIESDEKNTTYIISIPYVSSENGKKKYRALPIGLFISQNGILYVSHSTHPILKDIKNGNIAGMDLSKKDSFPIYFISKSCEYYLKYLYEIGEDILKKEKTLMKSTSNHDLERMFTLQKSLLYFTTSLQGNLTILEKLINNTKWNSKEIELIKDTQIEIKQGIEMAKIYREILENTMDTYSSIISNNLNDIMKFLTSITLVISIPTMISSFLGMNVYLGDFGTNPYSFWLITFLGFLISLLLIYILKKKNLL